VNGVENTKRRRTSDIDAERRPAAGASSSRNTGGSILNGVEIEDAG
jgi:hypothetical protein